LLAAEEILRDRALSFHIYLWQDTTAVFWQEKNLCCLLISDAAPKEVIRLAQTSADNQGGDGRTSPA